MASSSAVSLSSFCLCSRFLVKESEDFWIILSARRKERGTAAAASSVGLILLPRHFLFKFLTFFSTQERRHKIDTSNTSIFKFGLDLIFCFSRKENGVFQCLLIIIIIIILNVPSFKVSLSLSLYYNLSAPYHFELHSCMHISLCLGYLKSENGYLSCCFLLFVFWVEFEMLMDSVRREEERNIPALFENWKGETGREGPLLITRPWDCSFASLIHFLIALWIVALAYQKPLYSISQSIAASCPPLLSFSLLNTNPNVFGPWPMTHQQFLFRLRIGMKQSVTQLHLKTFQGCVFCGMP